MKYEYTIVEALLPIKVETLDEMGKSRWELVAITTWTLLDEKTYISYFKRESVK